MAALLMAACLYVFVRQWTRLGHVWSEFRFLQTGAGLACVLTLLHDTVDYNLSIPANIVYFAFMAGIFFHPHKDLPRVRKRSTKRASLDETRSRNLLPESFGSDTSNPFYD